MDENLSNLLKEYGLDNNEIRVYLSLIGEKELTAYKISKKSSIHRSTCYDILERLIGKGFVSKLEKEGVLYYSVNELNKVISSLKDKENILINLIPKLAELENKQDNKINLLEGKDSQKQFNFNLFNLAKNGKLSFCYIIGNTHASNLSSNIFIEKLIKETKKLKIDYKGIWNPKYKKEGLIKEYSSLGENRFIDVPSKVGVIIFNDHIAFLYTTDQPYAIEIKNKIISDEMKSYFLHLWGISEPD